MPSTVQELLHHLTQQFSHSSETASLDAQVLISHHLERPRTWILAHPEAELTDLQYKEILQSARRLEQGEPLPYIIGHWEFYNLDFWVTRDVLIPRPETELLVERAIRWLQIHPHKRRVVDVGTGSGCIGIAITKHVLDVQMILADRSDQALKIASLNVDKHGLHGKVHLIHSNLLDNVPGRFDLICANLPYIPAQVLDNLSVARREPLLALNGGEDGLKFIRLMIQQTKRHLDAGGLLLLEIDPTQCHQVMQIASKYLPLASVRIWQDLAGHDRCIEFEQHHWIFHLCRRQDWLKSQESGAYLPASLAIDGYIHCSPPSHILEVANRYYKNIADVIILWIDPKKLTSELRWEKVDDVFYPHVYGPINLEAVLRVIDLTPDSDGSYRALELPD